LRHNFAILKKILPKKRRLKASIDMNSIGVFEPHHIQKPFFDMSLNGSVLPFGIEKKRRYFGIYLPENQTSVCRTQRNISSNQVTVQVLLGENFFPSGNFVSQMSWMSQMSRLFSCGRLACLSL